MRVELVEGWRSRIFAVNMATQTYVAGLSVHVNGVHVGETGADGVFWLEGDRPPEKVEVALDNDGFEVVMSVFEQVEMSPGDPLIGYPFFVRRK